MFLHCFNLFDVQQVFWCSITLNWTVVVLGKAAKVQWCTSLCDAARALLPWHGAADSSGASYLRWFSVFPGSSWSYTICSGVPWKSFGTCLQVSEVTPSCCLDKTREVLHLAKIQGCMYSVCMGLYELLCTLKVDLSKNLVLCHLLRKIPSCINQIWNNMTS